MATVGEIQAHQSPVGRHESLVDLQVGGTATQGLNIYTPLLRVQMEGLKGTLLAKQFDLIDVLVTTVVPSTGQAFGVLVGHGRTEGIEDSTRGDILRGNEDDGFPLTLDLLLHDLGDLGVGVDKRPLEELVVNVC